jgi:hypothetical protein
MIKTGYKYRIERRQHQINDIYKINMYVFRQWSVTYRTGIIVGRIEHQKIVYAGVGRMSESTVGRLGT